MIGFYNIDCLEIMKKIPDKYYDLALVDPPYGHCNVGTDRSGIVINGSLKERIKGGEYEDVTWNIAPSREYFTELKRISKHQVIFGFNFLRHLVGEEYNSQGLIIWDKVNSGSDQYPVEIAYQSFDDKPHLFRYMWRGMFQGKSISEGHIQQGNKKLNEKRIHIMQKPVNLYKWILKEFEITADKKIIDTHVGSASSLIAFHDNGNEYLGTELDEITFVKAKERLNTHTMQIRMDMMGGSEHGICII